MFENSVIFDTFIIDCNTLMHDEYEKRIKAVWR